ncbi:hypothetical protein BDV39DRAFT_165548 [Aspergillus sergii]|uniref:Uncharacterized protein n=1 Tax=Aspergillus sergii TaxID=1034303 RepID=A0A5N6XM64_9EURO|nr:hypothetical protein BDV39DRAFT_165548 [Aspergillus sergii]
MTSLAPIVIALNIVQTISTSQSRRYHSTFSARLSRISVLRRYTPHLPVHTNIWQRDIFESIVTSLGSIPLLIFKSSHV